jgi:hypothetical protein
MDIKERAKLKSMQINNALGLFILFFGGFGLQDISISIF